VAERSSAWSIGRPPGGLPPSWICSGHIRKIIRGYPAGEVLYGGQVRVERHWWNGDRTTHGRRDVYIRTDGQLWEVEAQAGGSDGRSTVQQCPGETSAVILASAWLGGRSHWQQLVP